MDKEDIHHEWIRKIPYAMEYYSAYKKEILPFATTQVGTECILPSEISHIETDKYYVSLTYGI